MATEVAETFETEAELVETAPAPVISAELPDIKLFGRWSCDEVQVSDMSLQVSSTGSHFLNWILTNILNSLVFRIILLLKRNTLAIYHIQLDDSPSSVSVRHNAQLLSVSHAH